MTNKIIGSHRGATCVAGCRVTKHGLHLGHVYGSFHSLETLQSVNATYFVLSDTHSGERFRHHRAIRKVAFQLKALSQIYRPVIPSRESTLRPALGQLLSDMTEVITFKRLDSILPDHVSADRDNLALSDYLFPLFQSAYMLGVGASVALYNDDNKRFVDLARQLAGRVNREFGYHLIEHLHIPPKQPPRLLGHDGRRMTIGNSNFLALDASDAQVANFCKKLVGSLTPTDVEFSDSAETDGELALYALCGVSEETRVRGHERIEKLVAALRAYYARYREARKLVEEARMEEFLEQGERDTVNAIDDVLNKRTAR